MSSPKVYTYHCTFCSHLLLATTLSLSTLPTRQPPSLDRAIIAPLPPPPRNPESTSDSEPSSESSSPDSSDSDSASEPEPENPNIRPPRPRKQKEYTLLLSSTRERTAKIVTREDGFEKRFLWRCGRCKVVLGYQLDEAHYPSASLANTTTATLAAGSDGKGKEKEKDSCSGDGVPRRRRKRKDYIYFLQGALMPTEELGKEVKDEDVEGVEV